MTGKKSDGVPAPKKPFDQFFTSPGAAAKEEVSSNSSPVPRPPSPRFILLPDSPRSPLSSLQSKIHTSVCSIVCAANTRNLFEPVEYKGKVRGLANGERPLPPAPRS